MKESKPDTIRNVAVLSYGGAGKTTLIEAFVCPSGTMPLMGSVVAGTTAMDYDPEEHHRKVSIQTSLCQISWNDTALNLLDNPGAPSFQAEAKQAAHVADGALWVFNAGAGVKTELEKLWEYATERALPGLIFISGLDKEGPPGRRWSRRSRRRWRSRRSCSACRSGRRPPWKGWWTSSPERRIGTRRMGAGNGRRPRCRWP